MQRFAVDCVVDAKARLGEAAFWDARTQRLWWSDIEGCLLHRYDPATGTDETWPMECEVGCLAPRAAGGLVLAMRDGFWLWDEASGERRPVTDPEADRPANRFNDGTTDLQGRFWAGSARIHDREPMAAFWRLDPDHSVAGPFWDGTRTTNGLAFSPDGRTMYLSDSAPQTRTIFACDYDPETGTPGERRVFAHTDDLAGRPDGGTVDAEGCYWMAGVGGWQLVRFTPMGRVDLIVPFPAERPSRIAFGGPDLSTMYVTTIGTGLTPGSEEKQPQAGGLFALRVPGVSGLELAPFAG